MNIELSDSELRIARIGVRCWIEDLEKQQIYCASMLSEDGLKKLQGLVDDAYMLLIKLEKIT